MITNPIYLEDPYLKTSNATILEIILEKDGIYRLILDQTIFYPMGGGQPTDQGFIIFSDNNKNEVYQVLLKDGEINHYVKMSHAPKKGDLVQLHIDWDRRYKNMKVHSAGHVVDFAMHLLGYSPLHLSPLKGDHGKKPYILYSGKLNEDIKDKLQNKVDELLNLDLKFSWSFETLEVIEKEALYLQPGLPKNKPLRALRLSGVGTVLDGGTIVSSTIEIGKILIHSIDHSDANTTIHYQLS